VRQSEEQTLLAIQDTTTLNFSTRSSLKGQGLIGKSKASETTGLHLHNTLLVGATTNRIYGLLGAKIYARDCNRSKQAPGTRNREPIEQKESYRWIESYNLTKKSQEELNTGAEFVNVGDREADIYELLKEASLHQEQGIGLLVRCKHNRVLKLPKTNKDKADEKSVRLWDLLSESPERGKMQVDLPRARGIKPRTANLVIRYQKIEVEVPAHKKKYLGMKGSVHLTVLEIKEEGNEELCWRLLTTEKITTLAAAKKIVRWYQLRWQVEVLHRVLKTGCRVEHRQLREMRRLKPMIALDLIVACYLMGMISDSRSNPAGAASAWLEEDEIEALDAYHQQRKKIKKRSSDAPLSIEEAVSRIGKLGGHLGRKGDGPPGAQTMWKGLQKLQTLTEAWKLFKTFS
jgi:hypothetical protein